MRGPGWSSEAAILWFCRALMFLAMISTKVRPLGSALSKVRGGRSLMACSILQWQPQRRQP